LVGSEVMKLERDELARDGVLKLNYLIPTSTDFDVAKERASGVADKAELRLAAVRRNRISA